MTEFLNKKIERAIKLIKSASLNAKNHNCILEVAYSGGKDSDVILELAKMAGVEFRAIYKNTTIDPPKTIKHVREKGVEVLQPKKNFFNLIKENGLPSNIRRFCCRVLKEYKVLDYAIIGIRRVESRMRNERYKEPEQCKVYSKTQKVRQYYPILDWTDEDVAEFINARKIKCHPLYYDENGNFHVERRLGCIGCPMLDKKRIEQFKEHPNFIKAYARSLKIYRETHKDNKITSYYKDEYEQLVRDIFYWRKSQKEWEALNNGLFQVPDGYYKKFLEEYFNIKFKEK